MNVRKQLHLLVASALCILAASAAAQQPAVAGATIEVLVHDSIAGWPLTAATVQLVSADDPRAFSRVAESDSLGRAVFLGIPNGRYDVGFMHPLLDAMGIMAPVRRLVVQGGDRQRITLAIPSQARVRLALCGPRMGSDSSGVFVGTLRDPRDRMPIGNASVTARWMEITIGRGNLTQRANGMTATTAANGWFALCGLPPGSVSLVARAGSDSTPSIDLRVEPGSLLRRDLFMSAEGHARLEGRVVTVDSVRPLAGARISLVDGRATTTDTSGKWSLPDAPLGTRMVEIRAVGFYPERRPVDVVADSPPVEVALQTFQAVLEAVRVTASRITGEAALSGFAERRRGSGMGRFLDSAAVARRNPMFTSDLLRTMPGFLGDGSLTMKGNFSDGAGGFDTNCTAEVYVDGHLLRGITAQELDGIVAPENIVGMEVYSTGSPKPAQFDSGMSGCGALVIWQKPMNERVRRRR